MRISDHIYFAPNVKFSQLSPDRGLLLSQYCARIEGYYLFPARALAEEGHAFASGLVLVSCIDALARIESDSASDVRQRFLSWVTQHLSSFSDENLAKRLYDDFRNGIVHESRVKNGSQFSLERSATVSKLGEILVINPLSLALEVEEALQDFIKRAMDEVVPWKNLQEYVKKYFKKEIHLARMEAKP
jgi:hypothetical protein